MKIKILTFLLVISFVNSLYSGDGTTTRTQQEVISRSFVSKSNSIAVSDVNYNVTSPTYVVINSATSGMRTIGFEVDYVSGFSIGGTNSYKINGGESIPLPPQTGYFTPVKQKRYINPVIEWTINSGSIIIVVEGYIK